MAKTIKKSDFNIGGVVVLNSGGPDMTVMHIIGTNPAKDFDYLATNHIVNDIVCRWFEDNSKNEDIFSPETIFLKKEIKTI